VYFIGVGVGKEGGCGGERGGEERGGPSGTMAYWVCDATLLSRKVSPLYIYIYIYTHIYVVEVRN
jgi:hypothetical protein